MQYCETPFRRLYIDFMGQVRLCGWHNGAPLGYITDGLEAIWHSEVANEVRRTILDGSFSRCRKDVCPLIMNNKLPTQTEGTLETLTLPVPEFISLAYDFICNLSCPSCRKEPIYGSPRAQELFDKIETELNPYLNKLAYLEIGGHGDPLFSKHSLRLLENLRPERADFKLCLQTNGTMFTPQIWEKIEHLGEFHLIVIVSLETLNPHVYAKLRRGGNFDALHENARFISQLRKQEKIKELYSVMVVQALNFMEMPLLLKYCTDLNFDIIQFENIYNWGTLTEKEYFANNLLNPEHPQHTFFKELLAKVLQDKRAVCWAGRTNRAASHWAAIGTSQCVVSEITPEDIVDADADFAALTKTIYNKGYIFVLKDGKYYGMLTDIDFREYWGAPGSASYTAGSICKKDYSAIQDEDISAVFQKKEEFINNCQSVFPVLRDGKLYAKMLIER